MRNDQQAPEDGNRVFKESDGKVFSAGQLDHPHAEFRADQGSYDRPNRAGNQAADQSMPHSTSAAPENAPVTMRAISCGGTFRRGVFGSLSLTSSARASTIRLYRVAGWIRKVNPQPSSCSQPR